MKVVSLLAMLILSTGALAQYSIKVIPTPPSHFAEDSGHWQEGINFEPIKKECTRYALAETIQNSKSIENYITRCEDEILKNQSGDPLISMAMVRYVPDKKEQYKTLLLNLGRGEQVRALLALKDTDKPLPLMIIKAGTLADGNVTSSGQAVYMHYFEESPFHVISLESTSSTHFMTNNRLGAIGGFLEGQHLVEAIKALSESEFGHKFSEYHIGGISLGGNAALFASIYGDRLEEKLRPKSVTAICPVVDLEQSVRPLFSEGYIGSLVSLGFPHVLESVWQYTDNLSLAFPDVDFDNMSTDTQLKILEKGSFDYLSSLSKGEVVGPTIDAVDMTEEGFFFHNNFMNFYKSASLPTYVIHAKDDMIVDYENNLGSLSRLLREENNPNITPISLKIGNHCAFNQAYGVEYYSTLLREIVLKNSSYKPEAVTMDLSTVLSNWKTSLFNQPKFKLGDKEIIIQYNFTKINDDHTAELTFSVFNPSRPTQSQDDIRCYEYEYDKAPDKCIRKIRGNISLRDLGLRQQYTDAGKNMLLRNLNTNSVIKNSNGSEIIGEGIYPSQLKLLKWSDSKDIFSF